MMAFPLYCPSCGYNLKGLPENRCPECGEPFEALPPPVQLPSEDFRKAAGRLLRRFLLASVILGIAGAPIALAGHTRSDPLTWLVIPWLAAILGTGVITAISIARLTSSDVFGFVVSGVALLPIVLAGEAGLVYISALLGIHLIAALAYVGS